MGRGWSLLASAPQGQPTPPVGVQGLAALGLRQTLAPLPVVWPIGDRRREERPPCTGVGRKTAHPSSGAGDDGCESVLSSLQGWFEACGLQASGHHGHQLRPGSPDRGRDRVLPGCDGLILGLA